MIKTIMIIITTMIIIMIIVVITVIVKITVKLLTIINSHNNSNDISNDNNNNKIVIMIIIKKNDNRKIKIDNSNVQSQLEVAAYILLSVFFIGGAHYVFINSFNAPFTFHILWQLILQTGVKFRQYCLRKHVTFLAKFK